MPLPAILGTALFGAAKGGFGALGLGGPLGLPNFGGTQRRRRRSRRRLTPGELQELAMIKNTLGRTAAANALPFYLGR